MGDMESRDIGPRLYLWQPYEQYLCMKCANTHDILGYSYVIAYGAGWAMVF